LYSRISVGEGCVIKDCTDKAAILTEYRITKMKNLHFERKWFYDIGILNISSMKEVESCKKKQTISDDIICLYKTYRINNTF